MQLSPTASDRVTAKPAFPFLDLKAQYRAIKGALQMQWQRIVDLRGYTPFAQVGHQLIPPGSANHKLVADVNAFAYLGYRATELPQAVAASREVLAIPTFPEISADQQALVVDSIASFYRG